MELSKRLGAVAELVTAGGTAADIGTDHGYIPIYLIESGKCSKVIAMDINAGPLKRAEEHIREHRLEGYIETRRSDGLKELKPGEARSAVIAGMGGGLVMKILSDSPSVVEDLSEIILQPQSEIEKVRDFLQQQGFIITKENMVMEEGKFYPMMRVIKGEDAPYDIMELRYGRLLLQQKHPTLKAFLDRELSIKQQVLAELSAQNSLSAGNRREMLLQEMECTKEAIERITDGL